MGCDKGALSLACSRLAARPRSDRSECIAPYGVTVAGEKVDRLPIIIGSIVEIIGLPQP
jgi:hypothetical protein